MDLNSNNFQRDCDEFIRETYKEIVKCCGIKSEYFNPSVEINGEEADEDE